MNYIYKITNDINNKLYIGQTTKTIEERFNGHIWESEHGDNSAIHSAIRKYGKEHFKVELVEEVDELVSLDDREIYWISYYDSYSKGYNLTKGGNKFGKKDYNPMHNPEVKRKVGLKLKGKNNPACRPEVREKIRKSATGKKASEETRKKMSVNNGRYWKGRHLPQYMIDALGKARSEKCSGRNNAAAKPFAMIDDNDDVVKEFGVYREAAEYIFSSELLKLVDPPTKGSNIGVITISTIIGKLRRVIDKDELFCGYKWVRLTKCND